MLPNFAHAVIVLPIRIYAKTTFLYQIRVYEKSTCRCINCNGYIGLHAWLNVANQKWSVTDAMFSCIFNLCVAKIALICARCPGARPTSGVLHQYNIKYFVHLFVLAEIYCCHRRLNIIVIPDVAPPLGLAVGLNYMHHPPIQIKDLRYMFLNIFGPSML